jgi:hypothetical protein
LNCNIESVFQPAFGPSQGSKVTHSKFCPVVNVINNPIVPIKTNTQEDINPNLDPKN